MITYLSNAATLEAEGKRRSESYAQNKPWPHIVIDDFVDPEALNLVRAEASAVRRSSYYEKFVDRKTDHNKYAFAPDVVGLETSRLINFLNAGPFIKYLESLTGITGLIADPSYFGGGLHKIQSGGYLEMHVDFNHLKRYNLERRINLLLYLNKDWKDSYHGELELWDRPSKTKQLAIQPLFNRCVIFETNEISFHGVNAVKCPEGGRTHVDRAVLLHEHVERLRRGAFNAFSYLAGQQGESQAFPRLSQHGVEFCASHFSQFDPRHQAARARPESDQHLAKIARVWRV